MWHQSVPRDRLKNLEFRRLVLQKALHSSRLRQGLLEACKRDILFFVNAMCWQYNPKWKTNTDADGNDAGNVASLRGPFITWEFQDAAILQMKKHIYKGEDFMIVKSREMGASFALLFLHLHSLLFGDHEKSLVISRSEEAVYRAGDSDSMLWKFDYMLRNLPSWMTEGVVKSKLVYYSERSGSSFTGTSTTENSGVGGRNLFISLDECSRMKNAAAIWDGVSQTTNCRIVNGTHFGTDTHFYALSQSDIAKVSLHWSQHPDRIRGAYHYDKFSHNFRIIDKQHPFAPDYKFHKSGKPLGGPFPGLRSEWYDLQCRRMSERAVAMDLDIDPAGSDDQFFETFMIRSLQGNYCRDPVWVGDLDYDPLTAEPKGLIHNPAGKLKLWVHPTHDGQLPKITASYGADISTGQGRTPSCVSGTDAKKGEKFLEFATASLRPDELAPLVVALCRLTKDENNNTAFLVWEANGPGVSFGKEVIGFGYRNFHWREDAARPLSQTRSQSPGWFATPGSKLLLLTDYRKALAQRTYVNYSKDALDECLKFKYVANTVKHAGELVDGAASGATVNHGDMATADALSAMGAAGRQQKIERETPAEIPVMSLAWFMDREAKADAGVGAWVS